MPQVGQEIGQLLLPDSDTRTCLRLEPLMLKLQFGFRGFVVLFFLNNEGIVQFGIFEMLISHPPLFLPS